MAGAPTASEGLFGWPEVLTPEVHGGKRGEGTPAPESRPREEPLQAPVESALRDAGFELVALRRIPMGGVVSVQILIDHGDGGGQPVTLGDCARASRAIQDQVDLDRYLPGRYSLEVSSPGLDRPLTRPAHYRRFQGTEVAVRLKAERGGQRLFRGTIAEADEEAVTLTIAGGGSERIEFSEIASARLQVDAWKGSGNRDAREGPSGMTSGRKSDPA